MFTLPHELYQVDDRAAKSGVLISRWVEVVTLTDATTLTPAVSSSVCPGGRIRVLNDVNILATAGATQTSTGYIFELLGGAGNRLYAVNNFFGGAALLAQRLVSENLIICAGETVRWTHTFSAFVNPNSLELRISGFEMPKGNVIG